MRDHPADKAYDEVIDEMTGKTVYEWVDVVRAVNQMRTRWKDFGTGGVDDD